MSTLLMHYTVPSEALPAVPKVGIVSLAIFAWRCGNCSADFHADIKPKYCPMCGTCFTREGRFGDYSR